MGYKHGSGLGRDEQGMSIALQVEKTSRRGGKILHEKDIASKGDTFIKIPYIFQLKPASHRSPNHITSRFRRAHIKAEKRREIIII